MMGEDVLWHDDDLAFADLKSETRSIVSLVEVFVRV